jgi:hypothetical protein
MWGVLEVVVALLILGVVRLLSDWSKTDTIKANDDKERKFPMKRSTVKKLRDSTTGIRSRWSGRKFWQYVLESTWAFGAGVLAARPLP